MTQFFIRINHYFQNHRAVCWSSMAALFIVFGFFAFQIHLEEDIDKLMPSSKNEDGTTKLAFADLKIKDKTFLLFEGKGTENLVEVCDHFVDSLLQRDSVSQTIDNVFYQLPEELMLDGVDYLTQHFPAYIDTTAYARFDTLLTREHMLAQMRQNHDDMTALVEGSEFGPFAYIILLAPRSPIAMKSGSPISWLIKSAALSPPAFACLSLLALMAGSLLSLPLPGCFFLSAEAACA